MDPKVLLQRLCRRHGVAPERGGRLLPLVRWALESPPEIRTRILAIVEETLSWHGRETEGDRALVGAANRSVLVAVARVLHDWSPSERILGIGPDADGPSAAS